MSALADSPVCGSAPVGEATAGGGPERRGRWRWAGAAGWGGAWLLAAILLAAQGRVLTQGYFEPDPSGYFLSAKQLARHGTLRFDGGDLLRFHEHMWVEETPGDVYAKYPPGYPLALALAWRLGGDRGMFWVSPICGSLGLLFVYGLIRRHASSWLAVVVAGWLAFNPMLIFYNGYPLSHGLDFAVVSAAMWALWNWWDRGGISRAAAAGLLLGFAPLVRYTEALLALPAAAVLLLRLAGVRPTGAEDGGGAADGRKRMARWLLEAAVMAGAAALCLVPLMAHHARAFGGPFRTGYDLSGEQTAFEIGRLASNLTLVLKNLNGDALFGVFPIAVLGLGLLLCHRRGWDALVFALWFLPSLAVYGAYYWTPGGYIYVRFQIATLGGYVALAAYFLHVGLRDRRARIAAAVSVSLLLLAVSSSEIRDHLKGPKGAAQLEMMAQEAAKHLPDDAVILADAPLSDYLLTLQDYTVYKSEVFNPGYGRRMLQKHGWEPMRQTNRAERISAFLGDDSARLMDLQRRVVETALADGKTVAMATRKGGGSHRARALGPAFSAVSLSIWESPVVWPHWSNQKPAWELYRIERGAAERPPSH